MAVVAKPYSLYTSGPQAVGALPANARIDVGNCSLFVLTFRGASGTALIQSTLDSVGDTGWQPLVYSTTLDGATTSGAVDYVDGTRLFVRGPLSFIQVNGTVTSGALTLWYFGWPFGASSGGTHIDFTDLEVILNGILLALEAQTTQLSINLQPVGPFNPLPVTVVDQGSTALLPGQNYIGQTGGQAVTVFVPIKRPADTTAYTANDVVNNAAGGQLLVKNAVRVPGGSAYLHAITVAGNQANGGGAETWQPQVWLYQNPRTTPLADNAPFTGSFTILYQQAMLMTQQLLPPLTSPTGSTVDQSKIENISVLLTAAPGSLDFAFDLETLTAFTPASGALYMVAFTLTQL